MFDTWLHRTPKRYGRILEAMTRLSRLPIRKRLSILLLLGGVAVASAYYVSNQMDLILDQPKLAPLPVMKVANPELSLMPIPAASLAPLVPVEALSLTVLKSWGSFIKDPEMDMSETKLVFETILSQGGPQLGILFGDLPANDFGRGSVLALQRSQWGSKLGLSRAIPVFRAQIVKLGGMPALPLLFIGKALEAQDHETLEFLGGYLHHPDKNVRAEVIRALGRLPGAVSHETALKMATDDPFVENRIFALGVLQEHPEPSLIPLMVKIIKAEGTPEPTATDPLKHQALEYLEGLSAVPHEVLTELAAELKKRGGTLAEYNRAVIVGLLANRGDPAFKRDLEALVDLPSVKNVEGGSPESRAVAGLARYGDAKSAALLRRVKNRPEFSRIAYQFTQAINEISNRLRQTSSDKPPVPYISEDACPFEGCHLGNWNASMDIPYYLSPTEVKKSGTFKRGDLLVTIQSEVHAVPKLLHFNCAIPEKGINVGDPYYSLNYTGEGNWDLWFKGKVYDAANLGKCELPEVKPESTWWVKVKSARGQEGWLKDPLHSVSGISKY